MKNVRKVRTQDGEITLLLLDGSTVKWNITTARLVLNELLALSRHEHVAKDAQKSQNEAFIRDAHTFLTLTGNPHNKYRFETIRLRYDRVAGKYVYYVILPPGFPLTLEETEELRETLREHTRFNGPGALVTPPELEEVNEEVYEEEEEKSKETDEDDCDDDGEECPNPTAISCETCPLFSECFPEETKEKPADSESADNADDEEE